MLMDAVAAQRFGGERGRRTADRGSGRADVRTCGCAGRWAGVRVRAAEVWEPRWACGGRTGWRPVCVHPDPSCVRRRSLELRMRLIYNPKI